MVNKRGVPIGPTWLTRTLALKTSFMQKGSPSNLKKHTAIRTKQNVSVQIDGQFKKFLGALKIAGKAVTSKQNKEGRKDKQEDGKTMDSNVRKS